MESRSVYYERLQGRLRAVLILVEDKLEPTTVELVTEMIDANEPGVALEMLVEMLLEGEVGITADAFAIVADLVGTMGLDGSVLERLRPLVNAHMGDGQHTHGKL